METAANTETVPSVVDVLREELAHGDAVLATTTPILRHLVNNGGNTMFGDDILASVRGMAEDLARQLLDAMDRAGGDMERREHEPAAISQLSSEFLNNPALLSHLHALALEWQLTCRLQARLSLDPVLTPLLQSLVASSSEETAAVAMNLLASQARFCRMQRRMQLPLNELPGDRLHSVLLTMRAHAEADAAADQCAIAAEEAIRAGFVESASRLALIGKLVGGMDSGAVGALSVAHAGVAIFLTALGLASGQSRDLTVLTTGESQAARLALTLSSAGLKLPAVQAAFFALHPDLALPQGFDGLGADRAAAILASAGMTAGL
jgi:hypothetical protein